MQKPPSDQRRAGPIREPGVPAPTPPTIDTVVFDVGNVLIPWDPRWLLARLLPDEAALARFLDEVDFGAWNEQHDAGLPFAHGIARLGARFPHYRLLCARYAVAPDRCVFIDDSTRNVEGARSVGMHALRFANVERLRGDLAALGVRC